MSDLKRLANPMLEDVWNCGVIDETDVFMCEDVYLGRLPAGLTTEDSSSLEYNIARIAWLAERGWPEDEQEPIRLAVELHDFAHRVVFVDGNHRVSAAIVMGDETISVEPSGNIGYLRDFIIPVSETTITL